MVVVVMGVAGAGKTLVGRALAVKLGWSFVDADDLHAPAAVAKMAAGIGLEDADRAPWLGAVARRVAAARASGESLVLACSALKHAYREALTGGAPGVRFVYLAISPTLALERLRGRRGHFAGPALSAGQFAALERPEGAIEVDASLGVVEIVDLVAERLFEGDARAKPR